MSSSVAQEQVMGFSGGAILPSGIGDSQYLGSAIKVPNLSNCGNSFNTVVSNSFFSQESNNQYLLKTPFSYPTNPIVGNLGSMDSALGNHAIPTLEADRGGFSQYKGAGMQEPKLSNDGNYYNTKIPNIFFPQESNNQNLPEIPFSYQTYLLQNPIHAEHSGVGGSQYKGAAMEEAKLTNGGNSSNATIPNNFFHQESNNPYLPETPFSYQTNPIVGLDMAFAKQVAIGGSQHIGAAMEEPKLINARNPSNNSFLQESNNQYLPEASFSNNQTNPIVGNFGNMDTASNNHNYQNLLGATGVHNGISSLPYYVKQTPEANRSTEADKLSELRLFLYKLQSQRGWSQQQFFKLFSNDPKLLDNLQGEDIVIMSKYHPGLDYLKAMLIHEDNTTKILVASLKHLLVLMNDNLGSSLFNKLVESCNEIQLNIVVYQLALQQCELRYVATTQYGTRSLQKLMSTLKKVNIQQTEIVILALAPRLKNLMMDHYGIQLISHCLNLFPSKQNKVIYEIAIAHCIEIAMHEKGCLALNSIIETINNSHREELLTKISENAVCLSQDPYGNYVVQKILQLANPIYTRMICNELRGSFVHLSTQKCGSHIVEKCIISTSLSSVALDLLNQGSDTLIHLARDQYGNYVIQKLLKTTKEKCWDLYWKLVTLLAQRKDMLRNHQNGRNVFCLLDSEKLII